MKFYATPAPMRAVSQRSSNIIVFSLLALAAGDCLFIAATALEFLILR